MKNKNMKAYRAVGHLTSALDAGGLLAARQARLFSVTTDSGLHGTEKLFGCSAEDMSFLYLLGIEAGLFDCPDCSIATIHRID